ncbi:class F sortase [Nocardioides sp. AE5]|uniref:class F sortase n=1 Tax=Nocardioides sp. AE5 TaxID=2962573 RepID=UPI002880F29E|nr:class F sortase [Nocardioides sp. AE5]MDT0200580.1 class F sortase [Nocardioides sp. AE5]
MRGRHLGIALAAAVAVALVVLCASALSGWRESADPAAPPAAASPAPTIAPTPSVTPVEAKPQTPGNPSRLIIEDLGVDAPVIPIKAPNGVLNPPASPSVMGWWSEGAQPGADRGSSLLTGHTMRAGGAPLQDLETVDVGARISVRTDTGTLDYRVVDVVVLSKDELAEQSPVLFDQASEHRLVVITCEDFDGTEWLSNVVVTAIPA